jgi:hypothetical protein
MTVARISLTPLSNIAAVFGVSVQRRYPGGDTESVCKEQSYERGLDRRQTREVCDNLRQ